jgi:sec-independent protein translocase protein TatA
MGEFSVVHWLIVGGILLLLFGPGKLPALGSGLGQAIRNFKKGLKEATDDEPSDAQQLKNKSDAIKVKMDAKDKEHH